MLPNFWASVVALLGLATSTAFADSAVNNTTAADVFVAGDGSVTFGINIPSDSSDLYFSLSGSADNSWIAVGMGSDKMQNSFIIMAYTSSHSNNVTISPRLSYGHVEPSYTVDATIQVLAGSGISNNTLIANGRCSGCRSWTSGGIDVTSTAQNMIFATGPSGSLNSDSFSADIQRHSTYGVFTMDLRKATGIAGLPLITAVDSGAVQVSETSDHDFSAPLHACIMISAFLGLMPGGILILRVMNRVKWHSINQTIASAAALIGTGIGIYAGTMYNRSMHWNSAHQIFGLVIMLAVVAQFTLGFLHHRIYKRTEATTKMAPIHIWLGRIVIPAGVANGFLGFPLALSSKYNWVLFAFTVFVAVALAGLIFWNARRKSRRSNFATSAGQPFHSSYVSPLNDLASASDINLGRIQQEQRPGYSQPASREGWSGIEPYDPI